MAWPGPRVESVSQLASTRPMTALLANGANEVMLGPSVVHDIAFLLKMPISVATATRRF